MSDPPVTPVLPNSHVLVSALGVMQILAWGCTFYLLAVLAPPIVAETGWSYEWVIGGLSVGLLGSGLVAPRIGRAIAAYGGRPVLALGAICLATGLILIGISTQLWIYYAGWIVLGIGISASLYDAAFSTLSVIYGKDARGPITAVTLFGGFANTVSWPLTAFLVAHLGWRGACFAHAAVQLAISLPTVLLLVPRKPRVQTATALSAPDAAPREKSALALRADQRLVFALVAVVVTVNSGILTIGGVHILSFLQGRGLTLAAAVALGTFVGPAQVGARVIEMWGGRHYHPVWTMIVATLLIACGMGLLWSGIGFYALAMVLYGAGVGISSIARGTMPLAFFGPAIYPIVMGRLALPALLSSAVAPLGGAFLLEYFGVEWTLAALTAVALFNVTAVTLLWRVSRHLRRAG
ncbi:MAG: MFS transporter [Pseudorhodoplanes sp.]